MKTAKESEILITAKYSKSKKDKKLAKILQVVIDYEYKKHENAIRAITSARFFIENAFATNTPDHVWDKIMEAILLDEFDTTQTQG